MQNMRANDYAVCTICWSWDEADAILSALEENKRLRESLEKMIRMYDNASNEYTAWNNHAYCINQIAKQALTTPEGDKR